MSHEKKNYHIPLNPGLLIGILIMVYNNPHIFGVFEPQNTRTSKLGTHFPQAKRDL